MSHDSERLKKSIMVALCFLNNHWGNRNLLCLALMTWVQFTSQLGFQDFITCGKHLYFFLLLPGKALWSLLCPPAWAEDSCPSGRRLVFPLPGSVPRAENMLLASPSPAWLWGTLCCPRHNSSRIQNRCILTPSKDPVKQSPYTFAIHKQYLKIKEITFYLEYNLCKIGHSS